MVTARTRVFDDAVNECVPRFAEADGIIVGSPVYFGNPNGTVLSFMQRLLYSSGLDLRMKVHHQDPEPRLASQPRGH